MPSRILADEDAERAVLGSILIDPAVLPQVQQLLMADDFYREMHGRIYAAMVGLAERGQAVDYVSVNETMQRRLQDEEGPGYMMAYLTSLLNATPTPLHGTYYAEKVRDHSLDRRIVGLCNEVATFVYGESTPSESMALMRSGLERLAGSVTTEDAVLEGIRSIAEHERILAERAELVASGREWPTFPWADLCRKVPHLRPGEVAVLGAESSVGKTAFAECCAEWWAGQGFRVVFFHLELSHTTMLNRRLSRRSGVPMTELERGSYPPAAVEGNRRIREWAANMTYVHCPGWSIERITALAEALSSRGLCDVMVLDYLTKVRPGTHMIRMSRNDQLAEQMEAVKSLVERRGMFALVLSQVNRASAHEVIKTGNALRASGEIEEKANLVLMLHRELLKEPMVADNVTYEKGARSPEASLQIDKQTNGPTGQVALWFDSQHIRFVGAVTEGLND